MSATLVDFPVRIPVEAAEAFEQERARQGMTGEDLLKICWDHWTMLNSAEQQHHYAKAQATLLGNPDGIKGWSGNKLENSMLFMALFGAWIERRPN